jgi:hypothetical protein
LEIQVLDEGEKRRDLNQGRDLNLLQA